MSLGDRNDGDFLEAILNEVNSGYGFVPIIGSGMSAPSGIPTGTEFAEYLFDCLTKVLNGTVDWNPDQPLWPRMEDGSPSKALSQASKLDWIRAQLDRYDAKGVSLEAIASLADWRTALTFLSRLPQIKKGPQGVDLSKLTLLAPAENVVDSSFIHITAGRQPSVSHMMMAHLSDALRIQTILTTNFDMLIEEAFARLGMPLTTFDVHQKAGLPSSPLVLAQRAVVKLHGGRYGLRADFSLDEIPPLKDQEAFVGLFRSLPFQTRRRASKHMLVMGVSGTDARTMDLIKYAAKNVHDLHIYWVCYRQDEVEEVRRKLDLGKQLKIRVEPDLGLFLLELYQRHYLSLPPAGAYYPAVARVPPGIFQLDANRAPRLPTRKTFDKYANDLNNAIDSQSKDSKKSAFVTAVGGDRHSSAGVSSVAAKSYESLYHKFRCIWLQLDHFADKNEFLVALVEAISHKVGVLSAVPTLPKIDLESCKEYLTRYLEQSYRPFLVFINGRDGPGKNAGWAKASRLWTSSEQYDFWDTILSLSDTDLRFVVLYGNGGLARPGGDLYIQKLDWNKRSIELHVDVLVERIGSLIKAERDENAAWRKARFIYSLTLFRHSCLPSALSTWGLVKAPSRLANGMDNDQARFKECRKLIKWLTGNGLIRHQCGGTVWMHSDVADAVRRNLEKPTFVSKTMAMKLRDERAACHQGIADWYVKLFRSSSDPLAALESLYHRLCCLQHANRFNDPYDLRGTSVLEAIETLKLARSRILSCGYVKTSSNLMKQIKDLGEEQKQMFTGIGQYATKLRRSCLELLRDFSREAAEFNEASTYTKLLQEECPQHDRPTNEEFDVTRLHCMVEQAQNLTSLRRYREAEIAFHGVFEAMQFGVFGRGLQFCEFRKYREKKRQIGEFVTEIRTSATKWRQDNHPGNEVLRLAVIALRKYMLLQMLIGQGYSLSNSRRRDHRSIERLQYAEAIYTAATTIMRYVEDHDFLQIENTRIRTHYGVVMASLKRYHEAHRRLNEASGYLSQSSLASDGLTWAVIELRRAETYLRQAEDEIHRMGTVGPRVSLKRADDRARLGRRAAAFLDDARYSLSRVEHCFVDQRKENWWWSLQYELNLWYFVTQIRLHEAIRRKTSRSVSGEAPLAQLNIPRCTKLVREGFEFLQSDIVRLARLVELLGLLVRYDEPNGKLGGLCVKAQQRLEFKFKSLSNSDCEAIPRSLRKYIELVLKQGDARN